MTTVRRDLLWGPLAVSVVTMLLVTLAIQRTGGHSGEVRVGALLVIDLFIVVAGVLYYLCWRLRHQPAHGWLAVSSLGIGLSELPIQLMALADPGVMLLPGAEPVEVLSMGLAAFANVQAARGAPFRRFDPVGLSIALASTVVIARVTIADWLPMPAGWLDGTALSQRLILIVLLVVSLVAIVRNGSLPWYVRYSVVVVSLVASSMSIFDDSHTPAIGTASAVTAALIGVVLMERLLAPTLRLVTETLARRREELADLAVRAATAESTVDQRQILIDLLRSLMSPLLRASQLREDDSVDSDQRTLLERALRRELSRANRMLRSPQLVVTEFSLDEVLDPLVEFTAARAGAVDWVGSGLWVRHSPDIVTRTVVAALDVVMGGSDTGRYAARLRADRFGDTVVVLVDRHGAEDPVPPGPPIMTGDTTGWDPVTEMELDSSRHLLRRHGGDLTVRSVAPRTPGMPGSCTVWLTLPGRAGPQ